MIERTYFHKFTHTSTTHAKVNGETKPTQATSNKYDCGYSQSSRGGGGGMNSEQTTHANYIRNTPKLFCDSSLAVKAGSVITVYDQLDVEVGVYKAGKPLTYDSHQEIPLLEETEA